MTPRKAVVIGCLISAGVGILVIAEFGSMIYHWCVTGELWTVGRSGIGGHFANYAKSSVEVMSFLAYTARSPQQAFSRFRSLYSTCYIIGRG